MGELEFLGLLVTALAAPILTYILTRLKSKSDIAALEARNQAELYKAEQRNDLKRDELLQKLLEEFREESKLKQKQLEKTEQQLRVATESVVALVEAKHVAETELDTLKPELAEQKRTNAALLATIEKALDANKALVNELRERTEQLVKALEENAELSEMRSRFEGLQHSFDALNRELIKREKEIDRLRVERNSAQEELKQKLEQFTSLMPDMAELQRQLKELMAGKEKEMEIVA